MRFFKSRIEKAERLIAKGYLDGAAQTLQGYLQAGLQEQSDVARLLEQANKLDETIRAAIVTLQQEYPEDAKKKMAELHGILERIRNLASAIATEEQSLEK